MRRLLAAVLIAGSFTSIGFTPASATAAPPAPPTITIDAPTTGHITGTVTSDQPYVWVRLASDVPATKLTLSAGSATFDLETWGFGSPSDSLSVSGTACPTDPATSDVCSGLGHSASFTPLDVTPDITWFTDATIGPGQADPTIGVADTGGGDLWAVFVSDGDRTTVKLAHNGSTQLPVNDGVGFVHVTRCATVNSFECNDAGFTAPQDQPLEVRRSADAQWTGGATATADVPDPVFGISTSRAAGTTYSLSWHLEDPSNPGTPVTTAAGNQSGDLTAGAVDAVTIDATGVADGIYALVGTITVDDPDFGTYINIPVNGYLDVDEIAPIVTSIHSTRSYVRPEAPDATNSVGLGADGPNASTNDVWEVLNGAQQVVRTISGWADDGVAWHASFDGRNDNGLMLPSGLYTIQLRDPAGNVSATTVQVRVQRLASRTLHRTVTAKGSKVDQYVGRCSRLASPSSHGWAGSLGYFANTRCRSTTGVDSTVATEHSIALPAAASYRDVQISGYGGAAKGFGRSVAVMYYEDPSRRNEVAKTILGAKVGTWAGPRKAASTMVKKVGTARYVFWTAGTAARQHYDVKGFTVTVRYRAWV